MSTLITNLIPFLAAALIAFVLYQAFFRNMDFSIGSSATSRVERFAAQDRRGITDKMGDSLVDRFGISFESWKHELMWAHLGGLYKDKTAGSILGQSVLYTGAGVAFIVIIHAFSPLYVIGIALAAYYPYMRLHGRADEVREAVKRSLPEAAALIAAEMSAGSSAETAITRAAILPGPLGNLMRQVVQTSQQAGRLIFSRDLIEGALVEEFACYKLPELVAFARQIDLVASKGADGPKQMSDVARSLTREYRSNIAKAAENLSNKLLMPISLYIFVPFMLAIFIPLLASVFTAL